MFKLNYFIFDTNCTTTENNLISENKFNFVVFKCPGRNSCYCYPPTLIFTSGFYCCQTKCTLLHCIIYSLKYLKN